jgi:hypothetical protein
VDDTTTAVQQFIANRDRSANGFLITLDNAGQPVIRQVGIFVEGWAPQTYVGASSLSARHLRRNPLGTYLWVQREPGGRAKNAWMRGQFEIVDDADEMAAFFERRAAVTGIRGAVRAAGEGVVLRMTPALVRAEGFLEGNAPFFVRQF